MSEQDKPKSEYRPESPTTAKALDFEDDIPDGPVSPIQSSPPSTTPKPGSGEDAPPPKPPRPQAPEQSAENTLREAFPSIDVAVVKAVLRASGGRLEPAFNALLGMSDPDAEEPPPPPQPPRRPQAPITPTSTEESQLAADERYARQLAAHYSGAAVYGGPPRSGPGPGPGPEPEYRRDQRRGPPRGPSGSRPNQYEEERERSFIDDDLPVIRDNIKKGFLETQSTVNKWVNSLKKKIDGVDDDDFRGRPAQGGQGYVPQQSISRRSSEYGRGSADRERYDADPQVLGDDFTALELRDSEAPPPRRSSRPLANPDLFKPTPPRPQSNSGRRVSFQAGPPEEIDVHYPKSADPINRPPSGAGKTSKWQPMVAVDPSPIADHDPFSLGDSDDDEAKKKDGKSEESERLKLAAADAMADGIGASDAKKVEPQENTRSRGQTNKETGSTVGKI